MEQNTKCYLYTFVEQYPLHNIQGLGYWYRSESSMDAGALETKFDRSWSRLIKFVTYYVCIHYEKKFILNRFKLDADPRLLPVEVRFYLV